mmetsp:Transcript_27556/g.80468  ORF Transcript_27556/g.80468 Transcript_27556/m.80468 type:complete len:216 (-) Transcript_27556:346-993(-)
MHLLSPALVSPPEFLLLQFTQPRRRREIVTLVVVHFRPLGSFVVETHQSLLQGKCSVVPGCLHHGVCAVQRLGTARAGPIGLLFLHGRHRDHVDVTTGQAVHDKPSARRLAVGLPHTLFLHGSRSLLQSNRMSEGLCGLSRSFRWFVGDPQATDYRRRSPGGFTATYSRSLLLAQPFMAGAGSCHGGWPRRRLGHRGLRQCLALPSRHCNGSCCS